MNYISHYYLDSILGQPYFNLGLALPDLMGNAQRRWKPLKRADAVHSGEEGIHLWSGINAHLAADAIFHNSDFFKSQSQQIRIRLENHGLHGKGPRLFFLAHICLELMLDRLIIKSYPGMADRFYHDLGSVSEAVIEEELQNAVNPDYGNFFQLFDRFRQVRYLYSYLEDDRMLYAINRIMGRAGQNGFEEHVHESLKLAMKETEEELSGQFLAFFEWMRERLRSEARIDLS